MEAKEHIPTQRISTPTPRYIPSKTAFVGSPEVYPRTCLATTGKNLDFHQHRNRSTHCSFTQKEYYPTIKKNTLWATSRMNFTYIISKKKKAGRVPFMSSSRTDKTNDGVIGCHNSGDPWGDGLMREEDASGALGKSGHFFS